MRLKLGSVVKIASLAALLAVAAPFVGTAIGSPDANPADRPSAPVSSILPRPGSLGADASPRDHALARLNAVVDAEKQLPLQSGTQTRAYIQPGQAKGTIVMYHGFTAGTWQFELLARKVYAAGFNVYVPRLPGHGFHDANGREDPRQLLTARNWRDYETFADSTFEDVTGLGAPISVIGLSVGGAVALRAAELHDDIVRVVAYAPFMQAHGAAKLGLSFEHLLDVLTFGVAGNTLSLVPGGWGKAVELQTASGERPGHAIFNLGTIYAATLLGREILANASHLKAPVQFFTTAIDHAADETTIRELYKRIGGPARQGWYQYPASEKVPHPMIHPYEDGGAGQTPALYEMTLRFLETGQMINRP